MFKTANPYDEPVTKATDENLTSEDWEANLDVCDKVSGEGEQGARNCVSAIQKRLAHRSANVQLYALILTDSLSKNAGVSAHREIASRSFSQTLIRLATDRNTHESVKRKAYSLVKEWSREYGSDPDLGIIGETYATLQKQLGHKYEDDNEPEPAEPSTDELRREDEELRRVLELSMHDQGGRQHWASQYGYDGAGGSGSGSSAAAAAGSSSAAGASSRPAAATAPASSSQPYAAQPAARASSSAYAAPSSSATPAASYQQSVQTAPSNGPTTVPSINVNGAPSTPAAAIAPAAAAAPSQPPAAVAAAASPAPAANTASAAAPAAAAATPAAPDANANANSTNTVSRVRALYDFHPSESGELGFQKGDIIRVLHSVYDHWWRGELRGEVGIFPVNYVEILPDPTPADLQREAEMEARVFEQAASIDSLLNKLKDLDPTRDNLAEDEELQELYQVSLSMRPKIIRLIDRYSAKITELKAMNDKFVRARGTFDRLMEESLAKYNPGVQSAAYTQVRPEYAGAVASAAVPSAYPQQQPQQQYAYGYPGQPQQAQPLQQQQQPPQVQAAQQAQAQAQYQPPAAALAQAQQLPPQQQQDYAKAWAEWYAANGYPEQAAQAAAAAAAAAAGQPHDFSQYAQPQAQPQVQAQQAQSAPQPLQQQPPAQGYPAQQPWAQPSAPAVAAGAGPSSSSSAVAGSSNALPQPTATDAGASASSDVPRDDEKRRLYERARAEADAFQRQGGVVDAYGMASGSGSGSGSGSAAGPSHAAAGGSSGVTSGVAGLSLV
ncbi:hypothetical protein OC844_003580 [Tilletia horrida]|nr:hypothetical protein OC844_003580 [Tilletia horrida]